MSRYIYYNTNVVNQRSNEKLPGIATFKKFYSIYPQNSVFIDRSGAIQVPVKTAVLYPIPKLVPFTKTFADVCNERAQSLFALARKLDAPIYVSWSGGIDSTTVLSAFLMNGNSEDIERLVVLLSEDSINEYPDFYARHIRGKLKCESMSLFPYIMGTHAMVVGGECSDQIFGSDVSVKLMLAKGPGIIHEPYQREVFLEFFQGIIQDPKTTELCVNLFETINRKSPVALRTNFDMLWWVSFCGKWQFCATRMLAYTAKRNVQGIRGDYLGSRFQQFFNTQDFELWSMNNLDKRIKDTWSTYKYPAKDYIYEFTKDNDYRINKMKRGSLGGAVQQQFSYNFVDTQCICYENLDASAYYEPNNDFIDAPLV